MHACWFSCGFKIMTPRLIAQQDLQHMHHLQYGISTSTNVPIITNRQHSLLSCVRAHAHMRLPTRDQMGTQPVIIKIPYNSKLHCYSSYIPPRGNKNPTSVLMRNILNTCNAFSISNVHHSQSSQFCHSMPNHPKHM